MSVFVLAGALGVGAYLVQQRQVTKTQAAGVVLTLSAPSSNPNVGDTFTVAVAIDAKDQSVTAADIRVKYDSNLLEATQIQNGSFLPTVLIPGTVGTGTANIVNGCLINANGAYPQTGTGILANITFKAKAGGTTTISFDSATAVAAKDQSSNVVATTNPAQITIVGGPTAPPSGTPTASPTTTPSGPKTGDINGDGSVNILDVNEILKHYGQPASTLPAADLNGDGSINILDVNIVLKHYGE